MSKKKKKCPTCGNRDELCEKCERAQLVEAKRLEMEQKAEGPEGQIDPKAKLAELSEQWDQANGKGRPQKTRVTTRVIAPPATPKARKKKTRKHTRVIPLPPPPTRLTEGTCLVAGCKGDGVKEKQGFCPACFSIGAHWSIRNGDLKAMSITPTEAQLEAFKEHFNR